VNIALKLGSVLGFKGDFKSAAEEFRQVLNSHPDNPSAHAYLGQALNQLGDWAKVASHLEKAVSLNPDDQPSKLSLSWLWATCPDDNVRNGVRAVKYAEELNELTKQKNPNVLATLATAYAEMENFSAAVTTETRALELVRPEQKNLKKAMEERLKLFQAGKPYREK